MQSINRFQAIRSLLTSSPAVSRPRPFSSAQELSHFLTCYRGWSFLNVNQDRCNWRPYKSRLQVLPLTQSLAASPISFSTTLVLERPLVSPENGEHVPISGSLPWGPLSLPSLTSPPSDHLLQASARASRGAFSSLTHLKQSLLPFSVPLYNFISSYSMHGIIIYICLFGIVGHISH